jgi:DNA-binding transcriptional MerR regulator
MAEAERSPNPTAPNPTERTLDELCALTQTPKRTVRYYIQIGLLDRPVGETRAARYGDAHLRRLLQIKQFTSAGFSLDRIRERLAQSETEEVYRRAPGTVEQWTKLVLDNGVELSVNPDVAMLSPAQVRALFKQVLQAYKDLKAADEAAEGGERGA